MPLRTGFQILVGLRACSYASARLVTYERSVVHAWEHTLALEHNSVDSLPFAHQCLVDRGPSTRDLGISLMEACAKGFDTAKCNTMMTMNLLIVPLSDAKEFCN